MGRCRGKATYEVKKIASWNHHFKDDDDNLIDEVILIAEYPNQPRFPKIKCQVQTETIYRFNKYQVQNPQKEKNET